MSALNAEIKPWFSANQNCREGRFNQVGNSFYLSQAVHNLSPGARWLYQCMGIESGGRRDFVFPHSAAKKYGIPKTTFDRHAAELVEKGFVERILPPGRERWVKAEYRFCLGWKECSK